MITLALLKLLAWIFGLLFSLFPTISVPDWLSISGPVGSVFGAAGSMGVWFPVQLVATVLATLLVVWGSSFLIKAARMVVSLFTGGGGSAA